MAFTAMPPQAFAPLFFVTCCRFTCFVCSLFAHSWRRACLVRFIAPLCVLFFLTVISVRAGVVHTAGSNLQVALVTYGPGTIYWERFGHVSLQLRDRISGQSINFNYGMFDFNQKNFFLNFARGHMIYQMEAQYSAPEEAVYRREGRSIVRQQLAFSPSQAVALRHFLLWNLLPQNVNYRYDYYVDNCATRVRDALNHALGDTLKTALTGHLGGMSYRQQTDRLMSSQPWLMLLIDLGLGPYADQPLTAWQEAFLPMELQAGLQRITLANHRRLVTRERVLSPGRIPEPPTQAPDLRWLLGVAGLLIGTLLLLTSCYGCSGFSLLGALYLFVAGMVGLVLLGLWTLTAHHACWANANLLLFNPLAFTLLPAMRRRSQNRRRVRAVLVLQLLALLVAMLIHFLPGVVQQNQPWVLFALPVWLAMSWGLLRNNA